ncbi:hypothetical protein COM62_22665, partial [Bacillus pseudomycoides]|uniref:hypothetical protein n=1 Tax=Bacillus pseudomycoides TaxID=64104 RepID=UPI000C00BFE2
SVYLKEKSYRFGDNIAAKPITFLFVLPLGKFHIFGSATLSSPSSFFIVVFQITKNKEANVRSLLLLVYIKLQKKETKTSCCARPTFIPSLPLDYVLHALEEGDFCWSTVKSNERI